MRRCVGSALMIERGVGGIRMMGRSVGVSIDGEGC